MTKQRQRERKKLRQARLNEAIRRGDPGSARTRAEKRVDEMLDEALDRLAPDDGVGGRAGAIRKASIDMPDERNGKA
jgi:hypothetical protein